MTKKRHLAIIRDLITLYQKYNEREISDAIGSIQRGEALKDLLTIATLSRDIAAKVPNTKRGPARSRKKARSSRDRFNTFVETLEDKSGEHNDQIVAFIKAIAERQVLQTSGALRDFAKYIDINVSTSKVDRLTVAINIGEALLGHSPEERSKILEMAMQMGRGVSSLNEWSEIIVKS